jgi:hypothetical protein
MNFRPRRFGLVPCLLAVLLAGVWGTESHAQILGILDSRAAGYFSTDNQFFTGGPANWFTDPAGQPALPPVTYPDPPFAAGNALPGVNGINWVPMPRSYFGSNVTANGTTVTATAITAAFVNTGPLSSPADVGILIPNNSRLGTTANQLAYTQINFSVDFDVGAAFGMNPGLATASYTTRYAVGNAPGSFAEVDATAWYWRINNVGAPVAFLGSLNLFGWWGPGQAGWTALTDIAFIGGITPAQAAAGDNLRVVGYFRMRVDPAEVEITSVPEPTTMAYFGLLGASYAGYHFFRRRNQLPGVDVNARKVA